MQLCFIFTKKKKNRHDKRNPVAYYRPLLKGQIIALKLLKQTA